MLWHALVVLLLAPSAFGQAKLKVSADRAVVLVVNMVPHTLGENGEVVVDLARGREGIQKVMVRNLLGQQLWRGEVDVPRGRVVRAAWRGRSFDILDSKPLRTAGARRGDPGAGARSLEALAGDGTVGDDPHLAALTAAKAPAPEPPEAATPAAETPAAAPAPVGKPGKLALVNRTRTWANAWVDGELTEFRGTADSVVLDLPTGPHHVVFKDYRDRSTWAEGTVTVHADLVVELYFGMHTPPEARNRPDAWQPR